MLIKTKLSFKISTVYSISAESYNNTSNDITSRIVGGKEVSTTDRGN
jgi:hypothetical protein